MNRIFLTVVLIALSTHASAASHKSAALQQAEREAAQKSRVAQPEHVGDLVYFVSEPHATEYKRSGATYVAIHFASMKLGPNDSLTVHTPDGKRSAEYAHVGQQPFWATSMPGGTALITLNNSSGTASYTVDLYYAGRSGNALATTNQGSFALQQVCGDDDSKEARCYAAETAYAKSKAVARLLINGGEACTGWLIGSEGHPLPNEHCVHGVNDSVQVEMMAEGDDCSTDCNQPFACPGVVLASAERNPATFVAASVKYDYALLKLDRSVPAKYGFLQARKTGPRQNEIV